MSKHTQKDPNKDSKTEKKGNRPMKGVKIVQIQKKKPVDGARGKKKYSFFNNFLTVFLILILLTFLFSEVISNDKDENRLAISEVAELVKTDQVESLIVRGSDVEVKLKTESFDDAQDEAKASEENIKETQKDEQTSIEETLSTYGVTAKQLSSIKIDVQNPTGFLFWLSVLLPILIPLIFIILIIYYLSRSVKGAGMQAFTFGQSRARLVNPNNGKEKITFKDVAGVEEAKQELSEIVDFLKSPKKFLDIGARIPKGVLLMGAPGTGKTLLARATAGEARVTFFTISGSEFVEMFVGVGASRVRDLFKLAKQSAPAIIFIDEIDAVGRARGVGTGGGNDEREQTLNQILVEMDGFEPNEKVIVMAATNRPDVLDPAILRPGRFDRRVTIDVPDRKDREAIMKIHAKGKPLAEDIDFGVVAQRTPGFSGADLYSLINEAAITAARENRKTVGQFDLIRSIEKVMLGPERRSHLLSPKERKITAYHEAGHALVASVLPNADPVHKISIVSRGRAGGYTLKLPDQETKLQSKKAFIDDLAMSLGGYVAEEMIFGDTTTGPSNDLQVSTALARSMVTRYGMSDSFGPIALESDGGQTIFGQGLDDKDYSQKVGDQIDEEVKKLMDNAYNKAKEVLTEHRNILEVIAKRLLDVENLERDEYEQILVANGISVAKREVESTNQNKSDSGQEDKSEESK
jgi:cell division protease FtsH